MSDDSTSKVNLSGQGDLTVEGDVVGRDAIKQTINMFVSFYAPKTGLSDIDIAGVSSKLEASLNHISDLGEGDLIVKALQEGLRDSLSQEVTASILADMETIGLVFGPVMETYLGGEHGKVIPYAPVINQLIHEMGVILNSLDAFELYQPGKGKTEFSEGAKSIELMALQLRFLSDFLNHRDGFSNLLGIDGAPNFLLGRYVAVQATGQTKREKTPTHFSLFLEDAVFFRRIIFDNKYFFRKYSRSQVRIDAAAFALFLFGLALDLVSYTRRIREEAHIGRSAMEALLSAYREEEAGK